MVTTMFDHILVPEGGHPTWEDNFIEKNTKMQGPFLSRTSKPYQQKQWYMMFYQKVH